jgi:dGTP triphosphohydrolase
LYKSPVVTQTFAKIGESMTAMFERLHDIVLQAHSRRSLGPLRREQGKWVGVLRAFLRDDIRDWLKEPPEQLVIDFIAGMTDEYYMTCYEEMFRKGKRWPLRAKLAV